VKRDTGNYQQALDLYGDGLEKARGLGEAYFVDYAVDALGMTYMLMGDLQKAEGLIRHAAAEVSERGGVYENGLLSLSLGILNHLRGEFSDSATRLEYAVRVLKGAAPLGRRRVHTSIWPTSTSRRTADAARWQRFRKWRVWLARSVTRPSSRPMRGAARRSRRSPHRSESVMACSRGYARTRPGGGPRWT
jgi:hypothetical protein